MYICVSLGGGGSYLQRGRLAEKVWEPPDRLFFFFCLCIFEWGCKRALRITITHLCNVLQVHKVHVLHLETFTKNGHTTWLYFKIQKIQRSWKHSGLPMRKNTREFSVTFSSSADITPPQLQLSLCQVSVSPVNQVHFNWMSWLSAQQHRDHWQQRIPLCLTRHPHFHYCWNHSPVPENLRNRPVCHRVLCHRFISRKEFFFFFFWWAWVKNPSPSSCAVRLAIIFTISRHESPTAVLKGRMLS